MTHIILGRYDVLRFPNYYSCSKTYQSRLLWQYKKIQDVKYLGSDYYAIYKCFLSAKDNLDYHPSMHTENDPNTSCKTSSPGFKRNAYNSHNAR